MSATNRTTQQTPTKLVWEKVLDQYRLSGWPDRHPLPRRKQKRLSIPAYARLYLASENEKKETTICTRCPVLDASIDGLAVKSPKSIQPGTCVLIDLHMGNVRITLQGKVLRNTGHPGSYRTSIVLELAD